MPTPTPTRMTAARPGWCASAAATTAWIGMVDGRVMLRDYQSLNGTFLNADLKTRVGDAVLADGDIVHFGGVVGEEFRLVVA